MKHVLQHTIGKLFLLALCVSLLSVALMGCDENTTELQAYAAPAADEGLIPLEFGNSWSYTVDRDSVACARSEVINDLIRECTENCNLIEGQCKTVCDDDFKECRANSNPFDFCLVRQQQCLTQCEADREDCVNTDCDSIANDPTRAACLQGDCFIAYGGVRTINGITDFYPGCDSRRQIRYYTDTVSAYVVNGERGYYSVSGDFLRGNAPGGVYAYGQTGYPAYDEPVLEFAYPAKKGQTYEVNYEERSTYRVTVVDVAVPVDASVVPAAAENGGTFYCYHYRFNRRDESDCGCSEEWNYYIAPGIGIVRIVAKDVSSGSQFFKDYEAVLSSYVAQ